LTTSSMLSTPSWRFSSPGENFIKHLSYLSLTLRQIRLERFILAGLSGYSNIWEPTPCGAL
jgi:hypothetical protein